MRIRRGLLFWGLLLIPLGAIPLIVRSGGLDAGWLVQAWRLWPIVLIGVGLAVLVGRTRAALVGTAVIALTIGSIGGAVLAAPQNWVGAVSDCDFSSPRQSLDRSGTFSRPASIRLDLRCGSVELTANGEPEWALAAQYRTTQPNVEFSGTGLSIRSATNGPANDDWTVSIPADQMGDVDLRANAAASTLILGDAALTRLVAEVNAGDLRIDAADASIQRVAITMNAGRVRLAAGSAPMTGRISVNAGQIDLCVPEEVGLRLDVTNQLTFDTNLGSEGLDQSGTEWTREATGGAPTIDLSIDGNAASLRLLPEGDC
jgi:hypothetical protein